MIFPPKIRDVNPKYLNDDSLLDDTFQLAKELIYKSLEVDDLIEQGTIYILGEKFIEHFHKLYNSDDNNLKKHWADEMSNNFFKPIMKIVFKSTNKGLQDDNIVDWFLTAGSNYETIIENSSQDEISAYNKFISYMVDTKDVYTALKEINLLIESLEEDFNNKRVSGGIYSIKDNKWLQKPIQQDIPEIDEEKLDNEFVEWEDKCADLNEEIDRKFLNGLVRKFKPKKLLELGVARGGSSIVLLNAIKDAQLFKSNFNQLVKSYLKIGKCFGETDF